MNHLVFGSVWPFLVAVILFLRSGCRASLSLLVLTPVAMVVCATWAVLPDLTRTFGLAGYNTDISMNPAIDIFFLHYTLNLHESYSPWLNVAFVAMPLTLLLAAWRELHLLECGGRA